MDRNARLVLVGAAVFLVAGPAGAEPQVNAALTAGIAAVGEGGQWWARTTPHLGVRGDAILGRTGNKDFGLGPFVEVLTAFSDVQVGGGASAHIPVHGYLPIVVSAGGYGRRTAEFGWEPGMSGQVFWGSRSYNYGGRYVLAGGLSLQGRWGLGDARERAVVLAAHIDGQLLALPLLMLVGALRGAGAE
jgi:hypothetical protein